MATVTADTLASGEAGMITKFSHVRMLEDSVPSSSTEGAVAVGPTGVYICVVPDAGNIRRPLYIGLYNNNY